MIADGAGNWTYFGPVSGPNITATATNGAGSTSEFSSPFTCGDFDSDATSDCSDADDDNDGYIDDAETGILLCKNAVNDDSFDAESIYFVNDGCPAIGVPETNCGGALDNDLDGYPNDGCPKDGTFSEAQFKIGTGARDPCGYDGWPSNTFDGGGSANKVDIQDLTSFLAPVRILNSSPGDAAFNSRWDLVPGPGVFAKFININDMTALIAGTSGFPPMFGGQRVFNHVCPFPP